MAAAPLYAQGPPLPDDPVKPHLTALLAVINTGDSADARAFVGAHLAPRFRDAMPMEAHLGALTQWQRDWKGAEIRSFDEERPNELIVGLAAQGRRGRLLVGYDATPPHLITGLQLQPDEAPLGEGVPSADVLEQRLDSLGRADLFSGVVLVGRGDRVRLRKAVGLADRAKQVPMTPESRLNIGSITKAFTGAAILRLAQEGRLQLDEPLGKYVDGFPADVASRVTIRQLLQHRSGMGDIFTSAQFRADPSKVRTLDDYLRIARSTPLEFEPGARERYSNLGYVVLGAVLQKVSGKPWHEAIVEYVYRPAGMTSSGVYDRTAAGIAQGYVGTPPNLEPNLATLPGLGSPAGGTYATADDLRRFALALFDHRLLDKAHTELWFNRFRDGRFGWGPVGVAGGAPGVNAELVMNPLTRDVIVVMSNRSPPSAARVAQQLEGEVRGWKDGA
jgi:CubicO group peptidase (beta-lactamase class C family)